MYRRFHDRFGTAGVVIAVIALIAALGGTAIAAGGLTAKQKKQVKAIAKRFQGTGPTGPAGANGAQGPAGAPGLDGLKGADGTDGVDGTDGADGTDGVDGSPWTPDGTLPGGATETGAWAFGELVDEEYTGTSSSQWRISISFPIPLPAAIAATETHVIDPTGQEWLTDPTTGVPTLFAQTACDGTVSAPAADPGHLCVYQGAHFGITQPVGGSLNGSIRSPASPSSTASTTGTSTAGAIINITGLNAVGTGNTTEPRGHGTFAVTAANP